MPLPQKVADRYDILSTLGEGGMGIVYLAHDSVVQREVAVKTIRDVPSQTALELFRKECSVLAAMSHPNIVEIFDIGEFEDEKGTRKPYFVMPLLRGDTLGQLIRSSSQRLTLERSIEIILQTCRGLQAAHERGLVHRDLKPNNIFVLPDDSVKIIDFGVAHMADLAATMTVKGGTLLYMAPEQIEMKPASPSSDIFSLGVVSYEILTGRRPFAFPTEPEVIEAILHHTPPPATEVNPSIPVIYSRIIHKAMAKQPWYRFSSARELAETLQKAQRNEPIEMFDASRLTPRLQRAAKALEQGNLEFAGEVVSELESAGEVDATLSDLRQRLDTARRQKILAQLLDSARTCMEGEEFLLALQKVQEVLQLDPQNATAMGMRNAIELRRNEHKVEEWVQLARRHLERNAFGHAREALEDILKISASDATAYQLLAECDRREEQFLKARKEKEELYRGALAAWKSGEVSSALSKLERLIELDQRVPDGGDTARSLSIQNFYNEVRSEQDLIRSSYQEARARVAEGNFAAALEICQKYIQKYPDHALFQALQFDVEEKRRQALSAQIVEIDRQVEAEANLERRVNLLRAAIEQHPGEPHFEQALRLAREKRDLVNGIVAKARAYEEQGLFNEALGQQEILGTIHKVFPGLEFEIERLQKRREQQALAESKARWVEQIDRHLESADYGRAMDLTAKALAEFPGDVELSALETLARQSQTRAGEAQAWWRQGQQHCVAGQYEEGLEALWKAWKLDSHNPALRGSLLQALVQRARGQLDSDWRTARQSVEEALRIDSAYAPAQSLLTLTQDREREENVTRVTAECRRLQAEGEVQAALTLVEEGLRTYPKEIRFGQLLTTLRKAMPGTAGPRTMAAAAGAQKLDVSLKLPDPMGLNAASGPVASPAIEGSAELPAPPVVDQGPVSEEARLVGVTTILSPSEVEGIPPLPPSGRAAKPVPAQLKSIGPAGLRERRGGGRWWIWAAAAVLGCAAIALPIAWFGSAPVDVQTNPAGAKLRVDGIFRGQSNLHLKLRPGPHQVEIAKNGYATSSYDLQVRRWFGARLNVSLQTLQPAAAETAADLAALRIATDLSKGELQIDNAAPVPLEDGQISLDHLPGGSHTFYIRSGSSEACLTLTAVPGARGEVASPIAVKGLQAVVITAMGTHARIYSTPPREVYVDGRRVGDAGPNGLDLDGISEGVHELGLKSGTENRTVQLRSGPGAAVSIFLASDRNVGSLLVVTGENGARVLVDGREQKNRTQNGQLLVGNLSVRDHVIQVFKNGFQDEPPVRVSIKKREEARLEFRLRAALVPASLVIHGGIAGAAVRIDQTLVGTIGEDGNFSARDVAPGPHEIEFSAHRYKTKRIQSTFQAGASVVISGAEASQELSMGRLHLRVEPADAMVTYARSGGKAQPASGAEIEVEEGTYTVTARAPGFIDQSELVQVGAGKTGAVALRLRKQVESVSVLRMDAWAAAGWSREDQWYVHRGGGCVLFPAKPVSGSVVFTALRRRHLLGNNRIQWVINYRDPLNYLLFEVDKKNMYRSEIVDGRKRELSKITLPVPPSGKQLQYTIRIDISGSTVEHFVQSGNEWVTIHTMTSNSNALADGAFGFYLPGNDELLVSGFAFTRKP